MDYTSKLLKGSGVILCTGIINAGMGYLMRVLLARKLSVDDFGLFFAVYHVLLVVALLNGLGVVQTPSKFVPEFMVKKQYGKIKTLFYFIFWTTFATSIIFVAAAYLFPHSLTTSYFKSNAAPWLLVILAMVIAADTLSKIISSFFLAIHQPVLFSLRELVVRITVVLSLLLMSTKLTVFGAAWLYGAGTALALGLNSIFFCKFFSFAGSRSKLTIDFIKKIFSFSAPLMVRDSFSVLLSYTDTLFLVYFRPLSEVAMYNVIVPTADLLSVIGRPLGMVFFPLASELSFSQNRDKLVFLLEKTHKYLLAVLAPVAVIITLFAGLILSTFFGKQYAPGTLGLSLLLLGFLLPTLSTIDYAALLGIGQPKAVTKIVIFTNALNVVLNIFFIPLFARFTAGYIGAIVTTIISSLLLFFLLSLSTHKYLQYVPPLRDFFFIILINGSLLLVGSFITKLAISPYLQMAIVGLLFLVAYPLLLFLFNVTSLQEILGLRDLLRRGIGKK